MTSSVEQFYIGEEKPLQQGGVHVGGRFFQVSPLIEPSFQHAWLTFATDQLTKIELLRSPATESINSLIS